MNWKFDNSSGYRSLIVYHYHKNESEMRPFEKTDIHCQNIGNELQIFNTYVSKMKTTTKKRLEMISQGSVCRLF